MSQLTTPTFLILNSFLSNSTNCKFTDLQTIIDGASYSPYVKITFYSDNTFITVGNESAPDFDNHTVIKSFDFGESDGVICNVEVMDEIGTPFHTFFSGLVKDLKDYNDTTHSVKVEFGWIAAGCGDSSAKLIKNPSPIYLIFTSADITFSEGKIKYKLTFSDTLQGVNASRQIKNFGTEDSYMPLDEALRQMFKTDYPEMDIKFLRKPKNSNAFDNSEWKFKDNPKSVWTSDNQNKLAVARKWGEGWVTDQNKAVIYSWDVTKQDPTIIAWESQVENTKGENAGGINIGTFIVNGGQCSNVLSFSPKINFVGKLASFGRGGNLTPGSGKSIEKKDAQEESGKSPNAGIQQSVQTTRYAWDTVGPDRAAEVNEKNQNINNAGDVQGGGIIPPIEAELRIQGDPRFCHPVYFGGGVYVSLLVVNPFYVSSNNDWLAYPAFNPEMTSKNWVIKKVSHSIREGSFVTTLVIMQINPEKEIK